MANVYDEPGTEEDRYNPASGTRSQRARRNIPSSRRGGTKQPGYGDVEQPRDTPDDQGENSADGSTPSDNALGNEDLRGAEEDAGKGSGGNTEKSKGADSPGGLKGAESAGSDGGLYNDEADKPGAVRRFRRGAQNVRNRAMSNKLMVGTVLGGSGGVLVLVVVLALGIGGYKVVDFAEHVGAYEFARTTRQSAQAVDAITAEKIGVDSAESSSASGTYNQLKNKYYSTPKANLQEKTASMFEKTEKYRPDKIISNYKTDGTLAFNYEETKYGRQVLKSINLNGENIPVANNTFKNMIPGYKFGKNITFARDVVPNLNDALRADNIGAITRTKVAAKIRSELGIGLVAWTVGKYAGKTDSQVREQVQQDAYDAERGGKAPDTSNLNGPEKTTADDVDKATDEAIHTEEGAKQAAEHPNAPLPQAEEAIEKGLAAKTIFAASETFLGAIFSVVAKAINSFNPLYTVGVPICLIYDGSLVNSGPTIDNQVQRAERRGVFVQKAKSQLQQGSPAVNGEAVNAMSWKIQDTDNTVAETRASGGRVNTSNYPSLEQSPTGQVSIADVGLGGTVGGVVDSLVNTKIAGGTTACEAITNVWVGVGLGAANIATMAVSAVLTGGLGGAAEASTEAAAQEAAQSAVSKVTTNIIKKYVTAKQNVKQIAKQTGQFAGKTAAQVAVTGGATLIARQIVENSVGSGAHSSLRNDSAYGDDSEAGLNAYTNQYSQEMNYGGPLADSDLQEDHSQNMKQLAYEQSQKSTYDRYVSLKNPDSLATHMGLALNSFFSGPIFDTISKIGASLINPVRFIGSSLGPLFNNAAFAARPITSVNTYFGNVQFGYTNEEQQLMEQSGYRPLANQLTLDSSGKSDEIDAVYKPCFDGSKTIGDLLTTKGENQNGDKEYYIVRNSDGNANSGICSQANIGPHNVKYGDLVFRWRLSHNYNNTFDWLISEQTIGDDDSGSGDSSATDSTDTTDTSDISGNAQELAKQVLANKNINLSVGRLVQSDVEAAAAGKNGSAGEQTSSAIFKLLLAVAKNHSVVITAIQSGGTGHCNDTPKSSCPNDAHYTGDGIDLGVLDGKMLTGRDSGSVAILKTAFKVLPKGSAFGQNTCGPSPTLPSGFTSFYDTCNHLHIQVPKGTP
jgi:hypothetical protein